MQEVTDSLKDYLRQEQYVKNMFKHREGKRKMNETRDLIIGIDFGKEYLRSVIMTARQRNRVHFP